MVGRTRARECLCGGGIRQQRWLRAHSGCCWILAAAALNLQSAASFGGRMPFSPQRVPKCPTPRPHRKPSLGWRCRDEMSYPLGDVGSRRPSSRACCVKSFRERALRRRARKSLPLPWATTSRQAHQQAASPPWLTEGQPLGMLKVATIAMVVLAAMPWCHSRGYEMSLASAGVWPTTRHEDSGMRPMMI